MENDDARYDSRWFGVPPKGERPIKSKRRYVLEILAVILIEFALWAIYRVLSAPYISPFGSMKFYLAHIVAAPTIALTPILIYWRYVRKEQGHPFNFTRKRIMTGIMVGILGAVLWRVMEMLVYDALGVMAGAYNPNTLTFYTLLKNMDTTLFAVMTFTQFFIVGPVEEMEFRGFTQDQASRAMSNPYALAFASILFGASHIPIAITIYHMSLEELIAAEVGWITAGAVFGALYMWSRNLWACMVMHGMGNWQLSVFFISSQYSTNAVDPGTLMWIDIMTAIIVNSIMVGVFYAVFRYYWLPQSRGELGLGGRLPSIQKKLWAHDFGRRPATRTAPLAIVFCALVVGGVMATSYTMGEKDLTKIMPNQSEGKSSSAGFREYVESRTDTGTLQEGDSVSYEVTTYSGAYVLEVKATVSWVDEDDMQPRLRVYENQPDTFTINIAGMGLNESATASNTHGSPGNVSVNLTLPSDEVMVAMEDGEGYTINVTVTLDEAGDYFPRTGPGLIGYVDNGNDYTLDMEIKWYSTGEEGG